MFDTLVTLTVSAAFVISLAAFAAFALVRHASGRPTSRVAGLAARMVGATTSHDTTSPTVASGGAPRPEPHRS